MFNWLPIWNAQLCNCRPFMHESECWFKSVNNRGSPSKNAWCRYLLLSSLQSRAELAYRGVRGATSHRQHWHGLDSIRDRGLIHAPQRDALAGTATVTEPPVSQVCYLSLLLYVADWHTSYWVTPDPANHNMGQGAITAIGRAYGIHKITTLFTLMLCSWQIRSVYIRYMPLFTRNFNLQHGLCI